MDNRVCLMEWQFMWAGWTGFNTVNYANPPSSALWFNDKERAMEWAREEVSKRYLTEKDITIVGTDEQIKALKEIIRDATQRLKNLESWSTQHPFNNDLNTK